MMAYFKPLRRKIGVLTLAIACLFMAGWVRSFGAFEILSRSLTNKIQLSVESGTGVLSIARTVHAPDFFKGEPLWHRYAAHQHIREGWNEFGWYLRFGDLGWGRRSFDPNIDDLLQVVIPYWSIVIPLTLLSAWLLLSKPRPATQKTTTESTTEKIG